jgi:hypothetical protein
LPTQSDRAALIATPTSASHAEVSAVLAVALGPREILLADDVLTRSSILTLEQGSGLNPAASGRNLEMPERFELVLNGNRCFLVRTSTGDRFALVDTDCVPAER